MAEVTGDFTDAQFAETEVADKVVEQYDEAQARVFYKYVMVRIRIRHWIALHCILLSFIISITHTHTHD